MNLELQSAAARVVCDVGLNAFHVRLIRENTKGARKPRYIPNFNNLQAKKDDDECRVIAALPIVVNAPSGRDLRLDFWER
jgi:hypothetical protein